MRPRRAALFLSWLLVSTVWACSRKEPSPAALASSRTEPAPAPAELAAELVVANPADFWAGLRALGGPGLPLPKSFELLAATLLELPALVASSIEGSRPLVGALLITPERGPELVLALGVRDGGELVPSLGHGADARFTPRPGKQPGLTLLEPKAAKGPARVLGVLRHHLLVAESAAGLETVAPYLVRTLAPRPPPAEPFVVEVSGKALAGPVSGQARAAWEAYQQRLRELERRGRAERGRAPDFGDPAALITAADGALRSLFDLLATLEKARVVLVPRPTVLEARLTLTPAPRGFAQEAIAGMPSADGQALLALPPDVALALLVHSSAEERAQAAKDAGLGLERLFGERLAERDRDRLRRAIASYHTSRGGYGVYGLSADRSLFFKTRPDDAEKLRAAVRDLSGAIAIPAVKGPLREYFGDFSLRRSPARDGVERFVLQPKAPGAAAFEAIFSTGSGVASLVAGRDVGPTLAALEGAEAGTSPRLDSDAEVVALLGSRATRISMALYVDVARLGLPGGHGGPVAVTFGRNGGNAELEVALSERALHALVRSGVR